MQLYGVYVPLITPFKDDKVDEEGLRKLVDYLIQEGVNGLIPCGTTGESATLTHEEHKKVVEIVVEHTAKRVPVIAGAGSNSTQEAIELTLHAYRTGADATLQITPYYNRPDQKGSIEHFKQIAHASPLPVVLYNIPKRTGLLLEVSTILELAEVPNIVGIKQSGIDFADSMEILRQVPDFAVFSGDDNLAFLVAAMGGCGAIAASAHIATGQWVRLFDLMREGKIGEARELHYRLLPLAKVLFIEPNPAPTKAALEMLGLPAGPPRMPIMPASDDCRAKVREVLLNLGLTLKA